MTHAGAGPLGECCGSLRPSQPADKSQAPQANALHQSVSPSKLAGCAQQRTGSACRHPLSQAWALTEAGKELSCVSLHLCPRLGAASDSHQRHKDLRRLQKCLQGTEPRRKVTVPSTLRPGRSLLLSQTTQAPAEALSVSPSLKDLQVPGPLTPGVSSHQGDHTPCLRPLPCHVPTSPSSEGLRGDPTSGTGF